MAKVSLALRHATGCNSLDLLSPAGCSELLTRAKMFHSIGVTAVEVLQERYLRNARAFASMRALDPPAEFR
jgi:hypothetical protein